MPHGNPAVDTTKPPDNGPYRAHDNRVEGREPITDGGRVMWGLERAVDYDSSPEVQRVSVRSLAAMMRRSEVRWPA
jgi:hypothetical protein